MNRIILTIIIALCCVIGVSGSNYNHDVQGRVADKITGDPIPAKIVLLDADSTVIDTTTAIVEDWPYQGVVSMYVFKGKITRKGRYIIKAVMPDYKDAYADFELKSFRQSSISVKPIMMEHKYHELQEVSVRATKIKMVMRGDTIVYNADAFNLADGSMLDALVSRLPGAHLTKDGQIFVNGKHVQSLLINGRDFFSGNPKMALENLPSYTVGKIKVYDQEGDASKLMATNMGDKSLVMDIRLKKEFDATIVGNIEGGIGTKERYLAKGFAMRSSQKEMIFAFANINNLNDCQKADPYGQWSAQAKPDGQHTNRTGNFSYARFYDSNMDKWISTQNTISHNGEYLQSTKATEIYLPSENLSKHTQDTNNTKITKFDSQNIFHYNERGSYSTITNLNFNYKLNQRQGSAHTTSKTYTTLNDLLEKNSDRSEHYNISFVSINDIKCVTDLLRSEVKVEYDKRKGREFSLYDLRYTGAERDLRDNHFQHNSHRWNIEGTVSYDWQWPGWSIRSEYHYNYKYNKTDNFLYRLDKLDGWRESDYDILPSTRDVLLTVIDKGNSYQLNEYQNHHKMLIEGCINAASGSNGLNIDYGYVRFPIRIANRQLYYNRLGRHDVSSRAVFFEPEVYMRGGKIVTWELGLNVKSEIPDLTLMTDYLDDSDPLNVVLGNPNLKNIHRYSASLSFSHEGKQMWNAYAKCVKTDNDIAYSTLYDKQTGKATMMPVSVDGDWYSEAGFDYSFPLDRARRWSLDNRITFRYDHSIDMTTTEEHSENMRSKVNNWKLGGAVKLNFRPNDKYEFTFHANGMYYYIGCSQSENGNTHAGDYDIGFETNIQLPCNFNFSTDCSLRARRGYKESMMNTTEWVWNAHIQRSFFKGALIAKIAALDILNQLCNTRYEMNKQGRTEVWHNTLPRYAMFSLTWKFNANPRKK